MPRGLGLGNTAWMGGSLDPWEAALCARCLSAGFHLTQFVWILGRGVASRLVALAGMSEWKHDFILGGSKRSR